MGYGVKVAHKTLTLAVWVRIPLPQFKQVWRNLADASDLSSDGDYTVWVQVPLPVLSRYGENGKRT